MKDRIQKISRGLVLAGGIISVTGCAQASSEVKQAPTPAPDLSYHNDKYKTFIGGEAGEVRFSSFSCYSEEQPVIEIGQKLTEVIFEGSVICDDFDTTQGRSLYSRSDIPPLEFRGLNSGQKYENVVFTTDLSVTSIKQ